MNQIARFQVSFVAAGFLCLSIMFGTYGFAAEDNPCTNEISKFCKNIKPGTSAMMDCLDAHENNLSAACKEYEATMGGKRSEMKEEVRQEAKIRQACSGDVAKFCKDVNPKQGGVVKCLRDHKNSLSAACKESIKAADAEKLKTN